MLVNMGVKNCSQSSRWSLTIVLCMMPAIPYLYRKCQMMHLRSVFAFFFFFRYIRLLVCNNPVINQKNSILTSPLNSYYYWLSMTFYTTALHPISAFLVFKTTRYFLYEILSLLCHGNDLPASFYWKSFTFCG